MPDIILTTLNARYTHAAFGLRYLMANLVALAGRAAMLEFDISHRTTDILERILGENPRIVGIGVYIWNARESLQLVGELKRLRPDVVVIVGGPEVSYETQLQEITTVADFVVTGEADQAFASLCGQILAGRRPLQRIIAADLPQFETPSRDDDATPPVSLPYSLYTKEDLAHRVIYVEASRGCPFKCEFCLSSLDVPVRNVPLDDFLAAMQDLLDRGAQSFKFVDRTFNLNLNISKAILSFFLEQWKPGMFLHFEMIPDRLPTPLRELIRQFEPGALQFEIGIQTFNESVSSLISRRQDNIRVEENLRWLRAETGVHVHADLIAGLPGEDITSFGAGFDRLVGLGPQEIQVGILKRLRGTPIIRHDVEWGMIYSPHAPYEVLQTKLIDFKTMQRVRRFSRFWDLVANSGNFTVTIPLMKVDGSPFAAFWAFSEFAYEAAGRTHAIALSRLAELVFYFLTERIGLAPQMAADVLWRDHLRCGRSDRPAFLKPFVGDAPIPRRGARGPAVAQRQARHLS